MKNKSELGETVAETLAFAQKMNLDPIAVLRHVADQYSMSDDDENCDTADQFVQLKGIATQAELAEMERIAMSSEEIDREDREIQFPRARDHWENKIRPGRTMTAREVYMEAGAAWRKHGKRLSHYMREQQALGRVQIIRKAQAGRDLYVKISGLIAKKD